MNDCVLLSIAPEEQRNRNHLSDHLNAARELANTGADSQCRLPLRAACWTPELRKALAGMWKVQTCQRRTPEFRGIPAVNLVATGREAPPHQPRLPTEGFCDVIKGSFGTLPVWLWCCISILSLSLGRHSGPSSSTSGPAWGGSWWVMLGIVHPISSPLQGGTILSRQTKTISSSQFSTYPYQCNIQKFFPLHLHRYLLLGIRLQACLPLGEYVTAATP